MDDLDAWLEGDESDSETDEGTSSPTSSSPFDGRKVAKKSFSMDPSSGSSGFKRGQTKKLNTPLSSLKE